MGAAAGWDVSARDAGPTGLLRWFLAIGESSLDKWEKAVLYSYLRFINWTTGEAYPSVGTLAIRASVSRRKIQQACATLRRLGVIANIAERDGLANLVRIDLAALEALTRARGAQGAGWEGAPGSARSRTARTGPAHVERRTSARGAPKPSIQNRPDEQTIGTDHAAAMVKAGASRAWMDGTGNGDSLRAVLAACGIQGANLDALAAVPALTAAAVRQEWEAIERCPGVGKRTNLLVWRLAKAHGLNLRGRGPIARDIAKLNAELLKRREQQMRGRREPL